MIFKTFITKISKFIYIENLQLNLINNLLFSINFKLYFLIHKTQIHIMFNNFKLDFIEIYLFLL